MKRELSDLNRDEIDINVIGYSATGKSAIQHLISQVLKDYGFNVVLRSNDYEGVAPLSNEDLEKRMNSVLEKHKVININEVQAVKNIKY